MRFRPRHYALFALLVAVFVFNLIRNHRAKPTPTTPIAVHTIPTPPADTPAWRAFDHATSLRDATDTAFQPALEDLRQQLQNSSNTTDLQGCLTWLEFYRQGVNHPSRDPSWKDRSQHHLDGCTKYHLDTTE